MCYKGWRGEGLSTIGLICNLCFMKYSRIIEKLMFRWIIVRLGYDRGNNLTLFLLLPADLSNSSNRDSVVSTTSTISTSTIGEERGSSPETLQTTDPLATLKMNEIGNLEEESLTEESVAVNESFKMYNTPV